MVGEAAAKRLQPIHLLEMWAILHGLASFAHLLRVSAGQTTLRLVNHQGLTPVQMTLHSHADNGQCKEESEEELRQKQR